MAQERNKDLAPVIADLRAAGASSLRQIAAALNARKVPTARGHTWQAVQVSRVLARLTFRCCAASRP
jgi:hypothetical protein